MERTIRLKLFGQLYKDMSFDAEIMSYVTGNSIDASNQWMKLKSTVSSVNNINVDLPYFQLREKIENISHLEPNWDSYHAERPTKEAVSSAYQLLDKLNDQNLLSSHFQVNVFPMRDGGIQFDLDEKDYEYEIEVKPDGNYRIIKYNQDADIVEKSDFSSYEIDSIKYVFEQEEYA